MQEVQHHPFSPIWDRGSRILILGSFPSVISREQDFYYANTRNRFWPMMEVLHGVRLPDVDARIQFLHEQHLALWDVVASCRISGSSDASLRDVVANDVAALLKDAPVGKVLTNGQAAHKAYQRLVLPETQVEDTVLPSTSPANASWSLERLCEVWGRALGIVGF